MQYLFSWPGVHSLHRTTLAAPPQKPSSVHKQFKNYSTHPRPALPVLFVCSIPLSVISTCSVLLNSEAAKGGNRTGNVKHSKICCVYWRPETACSSWATLSGHREGENGLSGLILPQCTSPAEREGAAALKTCMLQGLGGERVNVKEQRVPRAMHRTAEGMFLLLLFLVGFIRGVTDQDWKKILGIKKRMWMAT